MDSSGITNETVTVKMQVRRLKCQTTLSAYTQPFCCFLFILLSKVLKWVFYFPRWIRFPRIENIH